MDFNEKKVSFWEGIFALQKISSSFREIEIAWQKKKKTKKE